MVSDMVWRGLFHRHIRRAAAGQRRRPEPVQPDSDLKLLATPAAHTAETETVATVALMDSCCILQVYGPALTGAVPECTGTPEQHIRALRSTAERLKNKRLASRTLCD
jgi:hypothetical protein